MWKVFQNNTALTAEDLNDVLVEQAVITFANAAERDNAIPAPNPGMHCHLLSTKRTYYYDSSSGWIELLGASVSGLTARQTLVCTSTTRPSHAAGRIIYETDTGAIAVSDGSAWSFIDTKKQTYTPTINGAGFQLGSGGVNKGEYMRQGKLLNIKFTVYLGAGGSMPNTSDSWTWILPAGITVPTGAGNEQTLAAKVNNANTYHAGAYGYTMASTALQMMIPTGTQTMIPLSSVSPGGGAGFNAIMSGTLMIN